MDREILCYRRDYRNRLAAVSAIVLSMAFCGQALSQERGRFQMPTAQDMFRQSDRNGNGRLDPDEISGNPFLPRMLERAGLDTSRGITERDFTEAMDQARQSFERGGAGGARQFGGDRGGGERGGDRQFGGERGQRGRGNEGDNAGEERGRDRRRPSGQEQQRDAGSSDRRTRDGSNVRSSDSRSSSRPRVTIDLQEDLLPGDTDGDGQLSFAEWRAWQGKSLAEFNSLDTNGDGFVTPREVALIRGPTPEEIAATAAAAAARTAAAAEQQPGNGDQARRTDGNREDADRDQRRPVDVADFPGLAAEAERYFALMDRNRDGSIDPDEWQGQRIRAMFEDDGIDLEEPLSKEDFVVNYVRLSVEND